MKKYLSKAKNRTKEEFLNFYHNPVKYPLEITKEIAKDYWDVGTSFLTEWGISKYGLKVLKENNPYIRFANFVATGIPVLTSKERGGRNLLLQTASWAFFTGTTVGKVGCGFLVASGFYYDRKRRKKEREEKKNLKKPSLENKIS